MFILTRWSYNDVSQPKWVVDKFLRLYRQKSVCHDVNSQLEDLSNKKIPRHSIYCMCSYMFLLLYRFNTSGQLE